MSQRYGRGGIAIRALAAGVSLAALALAFAGSSAAARQPTLKERAAITAALPAAIQRYPVGCVWLGTKVSKNARFAKVVPSIFYPALPTCRRYASDGYFILKKTRKWRVIFTGSAPPPCSLRIPRDLLGSYGCKP